MSIHMTHDWCDRGICQMTKTRTANAGDAKRVSLHSRLNHHYQAEPRLARESCIEYPVRMLDGLPLEQPSHTFEWMLASVSEAN